MGTPLTTGSDWTFKLIDAYMQEIEDIAINDFQLDFYPNQIEIIHSEQMLDAYSSIGMPIMYPHWSFGQSFMTNQVHYQKGFMGLSYEIVINSNPCIAYLMEENTMTMQNLVMAHACIGHNTFFKNNYLYKQWTDAESIIDYLVYAKKYVMDCEDEHGPEVVEEVLDACHALQMYGVDKYKRPPSLSAVQEKERAKERREWNRRQMKEIWDTIPQTRIDPAEETERFPLEPQENLLHFIEDNAPNLDPWKKELVRIVRKISQYFYPQRQTQLMNEGCACFYHYEIMSKLREKNLITQGHMIEFLSSHTGVIYQPPYYHPGYRGINVYALGFAMYKDIQRVCMDPTDEDKRWFPDYAGCGDWKPTIKWAIETFKDESFVMQFLSPKVIRDFKLFSIIDNDRDPKLEVEAIHDDTGYKIVREALSDQYNIGYLIPDVQVYDVDRWGDRSMTLHHNVVNRRPLEPIMTQEVLKHATTLWGYDVILESRDHNNKDPDAVFQIRDGESLLDVFEHDLP